MGDVLGVVDGRGACHCASLGVGASRGSIAKRAAKDSQRYVDSHSLF